MAEKDKDILENIGEQEYKYGFTTDIETETIGKGLNEEVVRLISAKKGEPAWMTERRVAAYRHWLTLEPPTWAHLTIPPIDFQDIIYYAAPKPKKQLGSMDEVDPELKRTFDKLGIPLEEQMALAGVAVDAVMDSVSVKTTFKEVLAEKGMDEKIYPASMTKVMTLLVAAENLPDLDAAFTMTQAIIDPLYLAGASMAGFVNGEMVTMRDLLYGAVVPSGAEATEALAQAVAGSEEAFVAMMNEKAAALGLTNTHFMNTSGLHDENHYSTVREIALILQAALENETCAEILSAENYRASETEQHPDGLAMTNKFLYRVHHEYALNGAEITAAKTGYTTEAMNCCASAGKTPDGRSVICVTANAWTGDFCIEDHIALYTKYCGSTEAE